MKSLPEPPVAGGLRLHFNENTAGCSAAARQALEKLTREHLAMYPDCSAVAAMVAEWLGVASDAVQLTNGLDEGIQMAALCGTLHWGARTETPEIIIVDPAFEVYEECATAVRSRLVRVAPAPDFSFPVDGVLEALTPDTRVIYLTDPNNPTGVGIPAGVVDRIAHAAPQALVFVDEAYADFSGRTLVGDRLLQHRHLVIGRTFAKAHGLAALRIGAVVAHPETIAALKRVQLPFTVNIGAIAALEAALKDREYLDWYVAESAASRHETYAFCDTHGLTYWPSEGNFVLIRLGRDAAAVTRALAERRIFVRDKSTAPGCDGCIRLTTGVLAHTRRALTSLEDILAPRAN